MAPHNDLSDSIHGDVNVHNVTHGVLLKRWLIIAEAESEIQRFMSLFREIARGKESLCILSGSHTIAIGLFPCTMQA
jgi:hypothetical protein